MNVLTYLMDSRGFANGIQRLSAIRRRFGLSPERMEHALHRFLAIAQSYDCVPTLAVTAVLLERYPKVFQGLRGEGLELAIHGYVHTDYSQLDEPVQFTHMDRALKIFQHLGLSPQGFRCPYLRWNPDSLKAASRLGLAYGSNRGLTWDVIDEDSVNPTAWQAYQKGVRLWGARPASQFVSLPSRVNGSLLDIPVSHPDDEAMIDRLGLNGDSQLASVWLRVMEQVYERGELFTINLHHERVALCSSALEAVLSRSRGCQPSVWVAPLKDIADWWIRRRACHLDIQSLGDDTYRVATPPISGVTIVARGVESEPAATPWFGPYSVIPGTSSIIKSARPPFITISTDSSPALRTFLEEEGFAVREGDGSTQGELYMSGFASFNDTDKRRVIDIIEGSDAPLVRIWRWPNGGRCALSITGDVDAMTLVDFLRRPMEV